MPVNGVASVSAVPGYQPDGVNTSGEAVSLLPEPEGLSAMGQLYLIMSKDTLLSTESSKEQILSAHEQKQRALEKHIAELKKAMEDRDDAGFWGKISDAFSKIAGVVGIAAAAVITVSTAGAGGVALALALSGIALSGAAMAQSEWHFLEEIGVDPKIAGYLATGAALTGAALSFGAGLASTGGTAVATAGKVASATGGATSVAAGGTRVAATVYERSAAEHDVAAFQAKQTQQEAHRQLLVFIAAMEETAESDRDNVGRIVGSVESQGAALEMASQAV